MAKNKIVVRTGSRPPVDAIAAGAYLGGFSHWKVRDMAYKGEIASIKIGSRLLFDLDELDRYIAEHTRARVGVA